MGRQKVKQEKDGLTNEKKRLDAFGRIGNLEAGFAELVKSMNNSFKQIAQDNTANNSTIQEFDSLLQAMIEVLDVTEKKFSPALRESLTRIKKEKLEAQAEKKLAELKIMETEGKIAKVDTIESENDFVITTQKGEDGSQRYPTKAVGIVGMFIPAVKELLIGKKAGEVLTLPNNGTLEILEIYKLVEVQSDDSADSSVD